MNTPAKEKSKEETDWDNTRVGIEDKISQSGNQISALENQKQKIYDKYGITDPKTQDISGLSNDDAIKIETINSEIQREKKAKSKEEINLSIHEENKPVIEEAEESPMAVHADELINKNKENALQEPISESLLSREQGETTETGGEPQGMGQGVQGEEVAQEGKQEEVSVNREPIAEDIAPEQKAKIEESNAQDEDEAVTEIYDFNDEIKSVGTKEQFKAFLRSLSPKGVFSRIAWHNSDKEALQPREGQYYANSRRNAEETYKRDFTHPAIIFGNSPQKMDFDQVQEFDINDVKSQGNDIVITDDLSPAIGAEMNYREFIPSSAEQIIPIGTKENIEAFKAFVEQQKAPEVQPTEQVTEQVAEQATEQVQEEKEPTTEEQEAKLDEMEVSEANLVSEYEQIKNMSGIDKIDAMNKWKEKYGELATRYMYIENNYDKLAEQFKAIRTCEFE
jgi:acyl carrier protein phosphodiesterase